MSEERQARFERWLREYWGLLLKVVRGYAASAADQDDLLQETLISLWSSLPRFRGEAKETTWIYRVAIQTALVWRRGEQRRQRSLRALSADVARRRQTFAIDQPDEKPSIKRLYAAIRQLPKVDASLALMHLDGMSYSEMAQVLGISENYVGVKLNRLRKQLAELLDALQDED